MLGGSSGMNAMVYIRGHPEDYNEWARDLAPEVDPFLPSTRSHQIKSDQTIAHTTTPKGCPALEIRQRVEGDEKVREIQPSV